MIILLNNFTYFYSANEHLRVCYSDTSTNTLSHVWFTTVSILSYIEIDIY